MVGVNKCLRKRKIINFKGKVEDTGRKRYATEKEGAFKKLPLAYKWEG